MIQMWNENLCKQSQSVLFIVRVIRHSNMRLPIRKIKPDLKAGVIQRNKIDCRG